MYLSQFYTAMFVVPKIKIFWLFILIPALLYTGFYTMDHKLSAVRIKNVNGISMEPTIKDRSKVALKPSIGKITLNSVYTIERDEEKSLLIKRVIAGPGDKLTFNSLTGEWLKINDTEIIYQPLQGEHPVQYKFTRNDQTLRLQVIKRLNKYLGIETYTLHLPGLDAKIDRNRLTLDIVRFPFLRQHANSAGTTEITVPKDHYFVMSDNWVGNIDSRFFGPIHRSQFIDKASGILTTL